MCGIAGRVNFVTSKPVTEDLVARMADLLAHRGPDGAGVWARGHVGLAHRRLAIIDLSPAGRQPMATDDGRISITYNGEIYNFLELRRQLESDDYHFRSSTDTEVILALYRKYGVDCLRFLRGMFAFAIWDEPNQKLFIARDRAGKKPLSYWTDGDGIAFASEPKAFLADPSFSAEPDLEALSRYLTFQYVPTPLSAFKGVRKLPPAHFMVVQAGSISIQRYWKLSYAVKRHMSEADAAEELGARLREAVKLRLVSDVPLGAFLSGGIDSSCVVALMSELGSGPVKTFSIGFEEKAYDELEYARMVADKYATDHHEFIVRPDAVQILPRLIWHFNEPFADSSAVPTFILSGLTRRHVTVALNGDAGDENFAGYERYRANQIASQYDRVPDGLRRVVHRLLRIVPRSRSSRSFLGRTERFVEVLDEDRERRYIRWMSHFAPRVKDRLCRAEFLEAAGADASSVLLDSYAASDAPDFIDATLDVDVNNYLPDDLLVKVDIATMAHGLEGRSPFLDHELMEFAASLPSDLKLRGGITKYVLKRAAAPLLPSEIVNRPKMGFGVPLESWFRTDLKELAYDVLLSDTLRRRAYFDMATVRSLLDEHASGERSWHYQLWNLLVLELWHRMFIDRRPSVSAEAMSSLGVPVAV